MPKIKGIVGLTLEGKVDLRSRSKKNSKVVDYAIDMEEESAHIFEEKQVYKVNKDRTPKVFHDTTIMQEKEHSAIMEYLTANEFNAEEVISKLREKSSLNNRLVREEYYLLNEMVQELYEKDFDMIQILTAFINEFELDDSELKQIINYLFESNKHLLREELGGMFKGHTKKEISLIRFFS